MKKCCRHRRAPKLLWDVDPDKLKLKAESAVFHEECHI